MDQEIQQEIQQEIERLNQTVDDFALEMKSRLREQAIKGCRGWDDPASYHQISQMMIQHSSVLSGQEIDAANLAMILWYLRKQGDIR